MNASITQLSAILHRRLCSASLAAGAALILGSATALAQQPAPRATQPAPRVTPAAPPAQPGVRAGGAAVDLAQTPAPSPFTQPAPIDFEDHAGYVSLFDGKTLAGWDGNPRFWRVENGAIVGESTLTNRAGITYLVYRDIEAKDLTLKLEIKIEGTGSSGIQYRSKTGQALGPRAAANGVNSDWVMVGPQADLRANPEYTGGFFAQGTGMGYIAWLGQAVIQSKPDDKRLMGVIGNPIGLASFVKESDWNQYVIIARGGTCLHIVNGQVMAVLFDDDPNSRLNQSGLIGIQIEPPPPLKVSLRNIWLKKFN